MALTLDEFLQEERARLAKFEAYWRAANAVAPNAFPMAMDDGNEGAWYESWMGYNESDPLPKPGEYEPVPEGYVPPVETPAASAEPVKPTRRPRP